MAIETVGVTPGVGADIAVDNIDSKHHQLMKMEFGEDGTSTMVSRTDPMPGYQPSVISTANSTVTVLGAAAVFTGTSENVSDYATIQVSVWASHASATDGLSVQHSINGTNWDNVDTYTIAATTGKTFSFQPANFFRIVYTNGGTLQTGFRLQTIYHRVAIKASSQRTQDGLSNENDFEQAWSANSVYNPATGVWDRQRGDTTGTFIVGNVAHDSPDSGNGLKIAGVARIANPTAVTALDRVDAMFDKVGRQLTIVGQVRELMDDTSTTITSSTGATTIVAAQGAGVFADLTSLIISNSAGTATLVTLSDGTKSRIFSIAATGGIVIPFARPLKHSTANTAWTLTCGTSVASIYVVAQFEKNV